MPLTRSTPHPIVPREANPRQAAAMSSKHHVRHISRPRVFAATAGPSLRSPQGRSNPEPPVVLPWIASSAFGLLAMTASVGVLSSRTFSVLRRVEMAKLKFGVWIPTYAWSGGKSDPKNMKRIRASIEKCEEHGIDVWVIDHLLSAPGLYGNAWLEPLNALAFAAALTRKVKIATGILVLPVRHPVVLAKEISTLCHLSDNRYLFGVGPGWYAREFEVTGSRIEEWGGETL